MFPSHNRALKEWAVACEAMKAGEQIVLIRKGGIREENGEFVVADREFFLMPTYEHQDPKLLQPKYVSQLQEMGVHPRDPARVVIDTYAMVDTILTCDDERKLRLLARYHIWNERYIQMRVDYNPYDPLYVLVLRVFKLAKSVTIPLLKEYEGCKSWVTLREPIATAGIEPALSDLEFARLRSGVLEAIGSN